MVNWDDDRYADIGALQRLAVEASIDGLVLAGNERLLDVGCGDGIITTLLAERLPSGSVVGVDASSSLIDKATTRVPEAPPQPQFRVEDALALPFEGDFDIAVSFNALDWIEDQAAALTGIARSLDTGGRAYIQMTVATPNPRIEAVTVDVARRWRYRETFYDYKTPYFHVVPDSFFDIAAAGGFTVSDLEVKELSWQFDSTEDFKQWFAGSATVWIDQLKDSVVDDFVDEVIARYQLVTGEQALLRFSQMRASLALADK